ncbi:MAG TPA: BACON domain-containing carbohydrate-binding protein [Vicinamibacterales bacterium]|nr:BACON domain-containing carbohydrate-binding protein [Vicinamibacterales bacterium]
MAQSRPAISAIVVVTVLSALAARCGSSVTTVGPTPSKCPTTLGVAADGIGAGGGQSSVTVTTQPECAWTATADASWISELAPTSGQGSSVITFTAAPNPDGALREGGIVVNEQRVTVRQQAACLVVISPAMVSFTASGGAVQVDVSAPPSCAWSIQENVSWLSVSAPPMAGPARITMTAAANTGGSREAIVSVGGQAVRARQESAGSPAPQPPPTSDPAPAPDPTPQPPNSENPLPVPAPCTYGVSPTSVNVGGAAGSTSVTVTTGTACAWSIANGTPWIAVAGATTRTGPGSVSLSYTANNDAARVGMVTIAGLPFAISQASNCAYTLDPAIVNVNKNGDKDIRVDITTTSACSWTATTSDEWITLKGETSGTGSGALRFEVARNQGAARVGQIRIAGLVVTIDQQ